jgi:hypothetical protein
MVDDWTDAAFRDAAAAWSRGRLADLGIQVTGTVGQPHIRWWSTVLEVPIRGGRAWFKAVQQQYAHELALTTLLAGLRPTLVPDVLAVDEERNWVLLADAGARLRELDDGRGPVEHWEELLPRYAELQVASAPHAAELLAAGVPDLRLATLPARLDALLREPGLLVLGKPGGLSADDHARLRREIGQFMELCTRLDGLGVPATVQHDDLHDGNIFVRDGRHLLIDWGDACVSHPFHSLVVALRASAYRHGWPPGGAEVERLLDAYLEPWQLVANAQDLRAAADLARRTGTVQRSLAWAAALRSMPAAIREEEGESVPYGLRLYLQGGPWGTWDDGTF